ncbi:MAG: hypothetical protein RIG61_05665 [Deltaproteobacteria bacterium]
MISGPDYIKDVEKYFLSLAGEGIMLSSMDYSLISAWKQRGVPKELVLRGINRAFAEAGGKNKPDAGVPKSIRHCAEHVERCVEGYGPQTLENSPGNVRDVKFDGVLNETAEKLSGIIDAEKREELRNYYIDLRIRILRLRDSEKENLLKRINGVEEECMEEFFSGLSEGEKERIVSDAESLLKDRARYMTEDAYRESMISFRNEILANRHGIKSVS